MYSHYVTKCQLCQNSWNDIYIFFLNKIIIHGIWKTEIGKIEVDRWIKNIYKYIILKLTC